MSNNKSSILGIDLGASKIVTAFYDKHHNKCDVVLDNEELRHTSSCLAFTKDERQFSKAAEYQASNNPENTLFGRDIKRMIGNDFDEVTKTIDSKNTFINVVKDDNDECLLSVKYRNEDMNFYPEHMISMFLSRLKDNAEKRLSRTVNQAVVAVPCMFTTFQRYALMNACKAAGLDVKGIVNNTTAAAVRYVMENDVGDGKNILIFDMGATSIDVGIFKVDRSNIETLASNGSLDIGGESFVSRLVEHFKGPLDFDISDDKQKLIRLRDGCEKLKINLSTISYATFVIEAFHDEKPYELKIERDAFNNLCKPLFDKIDQIVKQSLQQSKLESHEIHHFIIIGGGGRITKVEENLKKLFNGKTLSRVMNPDESIAIGAAYYGEIFEESLMVQEKVSTEFNINIRHTTFVLIKSGSKLPTSNFITLKKNYSFPGNVKIFQNDKTVASLTNIPSKFDMIDIVAEVDKSGLAFLSTIGQSNFQEETQIVLNHKVSNDTKIRQMRGLNDTLAQREKERERVLQLLNKLEKSSYTYTRRIDSPELRNVLLENDIFAAINACKKVLAWIHNPKELTKDAIIEQQEILDEKCDTIIKKGEKIMQFKNDEATALELFNSHKMGKAIEMYNKLINEFNPEIFDRSFLITFRYNRAQALVSLEDDEAIKDLNFILNDAVCDQMIKIHCYLLRAKHFLRTQEYVQCLQDIEQLLVHASIISYIQKKDAFVLKLQATFGMFDQLVALKTPYQAMSMLNALISDQLFKNLEKEHDDLKGETYEKRAYCYYVWKKYEDALSDLEEAMKYTNEPFEIRRMRAHCYFHLNKIDEAEADIDAYLARKENDHLKELKGKITGIRKSIKFNEDLKYFDQALQNKAYPEVLFMSGRIRKDFPPLPDDIVVKLLKGDIQAYFHVEKYSEGRQDCNILLQKDNMDMWALRWKIKHNNGLNNKKAVQTDCEKFLKINPDDEEIRNIYKAVVPKSLYKKFLDWWHGNNGNEMHNISTNPSTEFVDDRISDDEGDIPKLKNKKKSPKELQERRHSGHTPEPGTEASGTVINIPPSAGFTPSVVHTTGKQQTNADVTSGNIDEKRKFFENNDKDNREQCHQQHTQSSKPKTSKNDKFDRNRSI